MDLKLARGKVLALTGASGEGKSTLASLITRLYEPRRGRITLDGLDIATLNPSWLRKQVTTTGQSARRTSETARTIVRSSHSACVVSRYIYMNSRALPASDPNMLFAA